jgi:hypothetical protein
MIHDAGHKSHYFKIKNFHCNIYLADNFLKIYEFYLIKQVIYWKIIVITLGFYLFIYLCFIFLFSIIRVFY